MFRGQIVITAVVGVEHQLGDHGISWWRRNEKDQHSPFAEQCFVFDSVDVMVADPAELREVIDTVGLCVSWYPSFEVVLNRGEDSAVKFGITRLDLR